MILEKVESKAEKILEALNIKTIPVPVEDIASKLNIKISRAPSSEFSGMLIRKNGHALIGINDDESTSRQRFTIAHELGHYFLHTKKDTFIEYTEYRDNKKEIMRTVPERQANMFAAALLMPRTYLEKDFKIIAKKGFTEDELEILAEKYQVSEDAMRFRLMNLNLKGQ
jgi:Zn-dependent peptidase ImmA (M78 family)